MKKTLIVLALLLVAGIAFGQTPVYIGAGGITLEWDAVTQKDSGGVPVPLDAGDVVEYEVWRSFAPTTDHLIAEEFMVLTPTVTHLATVSTGLQYNYAIRAKLTTDGGATVTYSDWLWSDIGGSPGPFYLVGASTDAPILTGSLRIQ